ncbi:IS3 family transposase [Flavobacterium taihuense]|uniref:IS3 family transposase n=1 Tax=Flavobacterium taihuense TaxID=2857508 RepID=UPI0034E1DA3B
MSRQAFYQKMNLCKKQKTDNEKLVKMVIDKRGEINQATGGRKLYQLLKDEMIQENIKMGRDNFFDFLRAHSLLVPKQRTFTRTTNSNHLFRKFKNLVQNKVPNQPEELWVSDITYLRLNGKNAYLALVTDAYSKQIKGFYIATNMKASLSIEALKMALKNRKYPQRKLIHHSDRGFHYCWPEYVKLLQDNEILISMTEKYDPYENAIAERLNKTMKYEFELNQTIPNKTLAQKMVMQNPEESIQASIDTNVKNMMLVHWAGFALAQHTWSEPVERFILEATSKNLKYCLPQMGELFGSNHSVTDAWWINQI